MIEVTINKVYEDRSCTISELFVQNRHVCLILQDGHRDVKEYGKTRIPAGRYEIVLRSQGDFHARYLRKFGRNFHRGMLWLKDVPGFTWILIHIGNTPEDTKGCLLTGTSAVTGKAFVSRSQEAYEKLYPILRDHLLAGRRVFITMDYS